MYRVTISGSFRRHLVEIQRVKSELEKAEFLVLSPGGTVSLGIEQGFTFLATDLSRNVRAVEDGHLEAIRRSDMLWIVCPDGILGTSTMFEIGFAIACDVPIVTQNKVHDQYDGLSDDLLRHIERIASIGEAIEIIERRRDGLRRLIPFLSGLRQR